MGLNVKVTLCRHAKLKANILFNPDAEKEKKRKEKVWNNSSVSIIIQPPWAAAIARIIGLSPRHHWTLITQDCMIHGVNSERTERSSEEMKGHDEETYPYSSLCSSPLHFQPQSISLTRKYRLVCNYEVMLPTAVRHSKSQHLPLFIHCYSSTRNTL